MRRVDAARFDHFDFFWTCAFIESGKLKFGITQNRVLFLVFRKNWIMKDFRIIRQSQFSFNKATSTYPNAISSLSRQKRIMNEPWQGKMSAANCCCTAVTLLWCLSFTRWSSETENNHLFLLLNIYRLVLMIYIFMSYSFNLLETLYKKRNRCSNSILLDGLSSLKNSCSASFDSFRFSKIIF